MPIAFDCRHCAAAINAPDTAAGQRLSCPRCAQLVEVPRMGAFPEPTHGSSVLSLAPESPARSRRPGRDEDQPRRRGERDDDERPRPRRDRDGDRDGDRARDRGRDGDRINSAALGLGICSLAIGVASLFPAMIPCLGHVFALPMGGIAFLLGAAGLVVSFVDRKRSIGIPIAGTAVSAIALGITITWMLLLSYASAKMADAAIQAGREASIREAEASKRRAEAERQSAEAERRRRADDAEREARRREEEARTAAKKAAAEERERLAQLEADMKASEKREAERKAARKAELEAETEGLRKYEEVARGKAKRGREEQATAELEEAKQGKARADAEAAAEGVMKKGELSDGDRHYVRGCVEGRLKYKPAADPAKVFLDVTKPVKDGDLGVPRYPNRFFDPRDFGTSSNMKIAQIIGEDELVIYPGLLCVKGVSTAGLTAGIKDGSRIDLKGVTVVADGKGTYTNGKGEEASVARLIAVDFKKVAPVMRSDALKKWVAARTALEEAKATVAARAEALREAERLHEAEVARRTAKIAELKGG